MSPHSFRIRLGSTLAGAAFLALNLGLPGGRTAAALAGPTPSEAPPVAPAAPVDKDEAGAAFGRLPLSLEENCSCSRERISRVLAEMDAKAIEEASAGGSIEVRCEFCGTHYRFDPADFRSEPS